MFLLRASADFPTTLGLGRERPFNEEGHTINVNIVLLKLYKLKTNWIGEQYNKIYSIKCFIFIFIPYFLGDGLSSLNFKFIFFITARK